MTIFSLKLLRNFRQVEKLHRHRQEIINHRDQLLLEREKLLEARENMQAQIASLEQESSRLRHERANLNPVLEASTKDGNHLNGTAIEQRWLVKDARGINLLLDKDSLVDLHVFHHDRWEEDRLEYLISLIRNTTKRDNENCYFFDVGSYFGQYSLVVKKTFPEINTLAFEANPYNYIQLRANLLLNDMIEDLRTFNRCVSDQIGRTNVSVPDRYNRGSAAVGGANLSSEESTFIVDNLVFDDEFKNIKGSLVFMKMDIEGSEPFALAGMKEFSQKNRMIIQIEDWNYPGSESSNLLADMGFSLIHDMRPDFFYANFELVT
ncbi:FkbM family methyltransferase [Sphingobium sp. JS3065]|uniref:FkbM family methyltransferase n=1 Tax=Sphingobium sp. JS3065 TaxID=2970925 RepID=UPI0022643D90|nr:FkbM family methyltransferase [Sphingobium sp. JS3065]UZW55073.1 FkbM family methyltransferase [Sphingobium sp. JS3065]